MHTKPEGRHSCPPFVPRPQKNPIRTKHVITALLIAALAAPALFPGSIQTAQAAPLADETAQFTAGAGRPPSPTAKDANGWTDLHYAAALNLTSLANHLLQSGAKADARLKSGGESFTDELKATLRRFGKNYHDWGRYEYTPLHVAAFENARDTAALLLEKGAAVNAKSTNWDTPLHFAAWKNARDTAALLLEKGAAVNAKNNSVWTPLHYATWGSAHDTVALLLENGAAANAKDDSETTPLHYAVMEHARDTITLLLENGATVNAKNTRGDTPLHDATRRNARDTAALLLEKGAAVNAKNNKGETPLALALRVNSKETAALLRQHGGKK